MDLSVGKQGNEIEGRAASVSGTAAKEIHTALIERNIDEVVFQPHDEIIFRRSEIVIDKDSIFVIFGKKESGTTLTNHTLDHLLELCNPKAYVILLGDTAPLTPILFDHGVDAISGTRVANSQLALNCISQGANFRQIKGTKRLTMIK